MDKIDSSQTALNRRNFLTKIWIGLGVVALTEFVISGLAFLIKGRKSTDKNPDAQRIVAGAAADFSRGTVTLIREGHLYLSRLDDGGFLAISRKCTHLGCAVPWIAERKQFECPCHSSIFDITGNIIKAPAPRALDIFPISFERDIVIIDISKPTKRSIFDTKQPVYLQERS